MRATNNNPPSKVPLWAALAMSIAGVLMVPKWHEDVAIKGAVWAFGAFLAICIFVAFRWKKKLSPRDLAKSRAISKAFSQGWVIGLVLIVSTALGWFFSRSEITQNFTYSFACVLFFLSACLALVMAYSKKSLFQDT